ncbi:hypothetical protein ACFVT5_35090 [Streptomyces sp. NPDC058001]|uniref:hypothetical protein n=1 Tax=Streptomyces sp. NPDC058001 TaxID=3346300 RepID=UPI0036ED26CD
MNLRLPAPVAGIVRHEMTVLLAFGLWVARRRHGVRRGDGNRVFGYAREQAALMYGFAFACVVETVGLAYLLRDWPAVHQVVLFLDVYTVVMIVGLQAVSVTRPHVLGPTSLRVRKGAHVDLRIPLDNVTAVRRELRTSHTRTEGELDLDIGAMTSVTLELAAPVERVTLFGRTQRVTVVRLHAEEPDALVRELRSRMEVREVEVQP